MLEIIFGLLDTDMELWESRRIQMGIDVVFVLSQVVGELEESGASIDGNRCVGEGRGEAGTERGVMSHSVAAETTHVGEKSAVRARKSEGRRQWPGRT